MKRIMAVVGVASVLGAACGGDTSGPVEDDVLPAELAGTWVANPACSPGCGYTLTSVSNPNAHVDLVATTGLTIKLVLARNGNASLDVATLHDAGTASVSGNTLYLTSGSTTDTVDYVVTATSLDLHFHTQVTEDFNNDGIPDAAKASAVLKKQ